MASSIAAKTTDLEWEKKAHSGLFFQEESDFSLPPARLEAGERLGAELSSCKVEQAEALLS